MTRVNKQAVAAAFGRAAQSYTKNNELQRRSARELLSLLAERNFNTVLDAGCGPGNDSRFWRNSGSWVTALDLSLAMMMRSRERNSANTYIVADIEALPLSSGQFDLVWSHLAVQWCESLSQALTSLYRVAHSGGKIAFTTLLNNSLHEIKQAWCAIDQHTHVNRFSTQEEIKDVLKSWSYRSRIQTIKLYFESARNAIRSIKGIGATHLHDGRSHQLITQRQLQLLEKSWPRETKSYPLTYRLFHGVIERD